MHHSTTDDEVEAERRRDEEERRRRREMRYRRQIAVGTWAGAVGAALLVALGVAAAFDVPTTTRIDLLRVCAAILVIGGLNARLRAAASLRAECRWSEQQRAWRLLMAERAEERRQAQAEREEDRQLLAAIVAAHAEQAEALGRYIALNEATVPHSAKARENMAAVRQDLEAVKSRVEAVHEFIAAQVHESGAVARVIHLQPPMQAEPSRTPRQRKRGRQRGGSDPQEPSSAAGQGGVWSPGDERWQKDVAEAAKLGRQLGPGPEPA